jgi:hypothetical protein
MYLNIYGELNFHRIECGAVMSLVCTAFSNYGLRKALVSEKSK